MNICKCVGVQLSYTTHLNTVLIKCTLHIWGTSAKQRVIVLTDSRHGVNTILRRIPDV